MLLLLMFFAFQDGTPLNFQKLRTESQELFQKGDYQGLLRASKHLNEIQPGHTPSLFNMALAYALLDQGQESLKCLKQVAERGLVLPFPAGDPFTALKEDPAYVEIQAIWSKNQAPQGSASLAFSVPEADFFPEGLAFDPQSHTFYVGSVHQRKIVMRKADGEFTTLVAAGQSGLMSVLGLAVDASRRCLWATSAGLPQTKDLAKTELGITSLFKFDLVAGKTLAVFPLTEKDRNLGDLVLAKNGDVYLSDAVGGGLYVCKGQAITPLLTSPWFRSPQGMCFSDDERQLYVADYTFGLLVVDLASNSVHQLKTVKPLNFSGIDGLTRSGDRLIGTSNAYEPHRVLAWQLDPKGQEIIAETVLLANHPDLDEPTLGLVSEGAYYFVANSQWGRYDKEGVPLPLTQLNPPRILKIDLGRP